MSRNRPTSIKTCKILINLIFYSTLIIFISFCLPAKAQELRNSDHLIKTAFTEYLKRFAYLNDESDSLILFVTENKFVLDSVGNAKVVQLNEKKLVDFFLDNELNSHPIFEIGNFVVNGNKITISVFCYEFVVKNKKNFKRKIYAGGSFLGENNSITFEYVCEKGEWKLSE